MFNLIVALYCKHTIWSGDILISTPNCMFVNHQSTFTKTSMFLMFSNKRTNSTSKMKYVFFCNKIFIGFLGSISRINILLHHYLYSLLFFRLFCSFVIYLYFRTSGYTAYNLLRS